MDEFRNTAKPDDDWWRALWPDPRGTLRALGVTDGSLLDCCCGDGFFTIPAAALVDGPVYALDLDPELLDDLDRRAAAADRRVETIRGDARAVDDLLAERVGTVLLANTLHGVPEPTELARRIRAALRDRGRFVVVNWHDRPATETTVLGEPRGPPEALRMSPDETVAAVEPAGFETVETVELEPYHYGVVFERA
ncbi:class I SAM-dependent methyltransferase [Halomarina halobia]|uniref:Class I SAM-dependent methyltransferase n=1 Tax=Halomarina halobia TaxID=3033386 RepID=A0ABD6A8G2_9EURY|nr:class I SAM-dependent methyltransferase [Halomarina sp. PSR21]